MQPEIVTLTVNGRTHQVALAPNVTLLHALRDLGYTDVKNGCEKGDCGACAVLLDGEAVNSCLVLAWQADGAEIVTNAGLGTHGPPPSAAGSLCRRRRGPVRLLHAGHDHLGQGAAGSEPAVPPRTRSARRSRAISAAAPATGRSSRRSRWRRRRWEAGGGDEIHSETLPAGRAARTAPGGQAAAPGGRAGQGGGRDRLRRRLFDAEHAARQGVPQQRALGAHQAGWT